MKTLQAPARPYSEVLADGLPRLGRHRCAGGGHHQLAARLLQADHGSERIVGPGVNLQHVLQAGHEGGVGRGRDHPLVL